MKNIYKRKNNKKIAFKSTPLLKTVLFLFLGIMVNTSALAQITFTTSQASAPRNAGGLIPADGIAVANLDTTGLGGGGLYDWVWSDVNTGNIVQTTTQSDVPVDTLNWASGTYALIVTNSDIFFTAKDTVTITAPGTNFSIGTGNGSLILCNGADSVNLTALELCNYPNAGGNCGYINQVLGTEFNLYNASTNILLYNTTVFNNLTPISFPTWVLGDFRITSINYDNGAVGDTTFTVSTDTLSLNVTSTNILNSFPQGTITVIPTGGSGTYSLCLISPTGPNCFNQPQWNNPPGSNYTLTGLTPGMYYFEVVSGDGCFGADSALIQDVCVGQITTTSYDFCDSVVTVAAEIDMVGTGPFNFEYSLTTGTSLIDFQTTSLDSIAFTNTVGSGTHFVTILETNTGCTITDFVTYNLTPVLVSTNLTQLSTPTSTDGSLFLSVDAGLAPYTYTWEEVGGLTSTSTNSTGIFTEFNLGAGTYNLTVTDANNCTYINSYEITYFPCIVTLSITDTITCVSGIGSITALIDTNGNGISGGPYTYSLYNATNGNLVTSFNSPAITQAFPGLSAGYYYLEVFDQAYGDICDPDTILLFEPDPIELFVTIIPASNPCVENGQIIIDSIVGGVGGFNVLWFDSLGFPLPLTTFTNFTGGIVMDSLGYSNPLSQGGGDFNVFIQDTGSTSCTKSFDYFIEPASTGADFYIDASSSEDTIYTSCYAACDANIEITMNGHGSGYNSGCESVGPFIFYWYEGFDAGILGQPDLLKVDSLGTLFYNPSGVATYKNLCADINANDLDGNFDGTIRLFAFDYYGNPALQGPGNPNVDGSLVFTIIQPDSLYINEYTTVNVSPNNIINTEEHIIPCGTSDTITAYVLGGPTVTDTTLWSTHTMDFGVPSGFNDTLPDMNDPNISYFLEVSGFYQDAFGGEFDAAYDFSPTFTTEIPIGPSHWDLNGSPAPRPNPDVYSSIHKYTYDLLFANIFGAYTFSMTQAGYACGGVGDCMTFKIYRVEQQASNYTYKWTEFSTAGPQIVSTSNTVSSFPDAIGGLDYVLTVTSATPGCLTQKLVHVEWDRQILEFDSIISTRVNCFGDASASIIVNIDSSLGFGDINIFMDSVLVSDTTTQLPGGDYLIFLRDSLGCESVDTIIIIDQIDSLWACGVDTQEVAILVESFTINMDASFAYTTAALMNAGAKHKMVVTGNYKDTWNGSNFKDASYNYASFPTQIVPPDWRWSGLTANQAYPPTHNSPAPQPFPISYQGNHEYTYYFNGDGLQHTFSYDDADSSYFENAGALNFEIYRIICAISDTAFSCYDDSTASAYVSPTGGKAPYTVSWADNNGTVVEIDSVSFGGTSNVDNLSAGLYTATISDINGCLYVRDLIVLQPNTPFEIDSLSHVDVLCRNDSTASIYFQLTGGFISHAGYVLNGADTIFSQTGILDTILIDGLAAGTYDLYVYDSIPDGLYGTYGCLEYRQIVITQPQDVLSTSVSLLSDVECYGDSTGKAIGSVIGGQFPYDIIWDAGTDTTNIIGTLWAGWQGVTFVDANGCIERDSIEIINLHDEIIGNLSVIENASCFGDCDAIASLTTTGGVLQHTYFWDTGQISVNMPDTVFGLCYGGHDVIVEDALGCRKTITYNISQPDELFAQAVMTQPVQCFGFNDGTAFATATGGTPGYSFDWDSYSQIGQNAINLTPGTHIINVIDQEGCTATDTVVITEPDLLTIDIIDSLTVYAYCAGTNSGQLCAVADGGTPNYNYVWNDVLGQTTTCATNLIADNYTVMVMDDRNCIATVSFNLDSITSSMTTDSVDITVNDVSCFGIYDGSISINNIVGGALPYTYNWTGPGNYTSSLSSLGSLYAGSYAVAIEDSNGCAITVNAEVMQPDQLEYTTYNVAEASCFGSCDGEIWVDVQGGSWPYYYDTDELGVFSLTNTLQLVQDSLIHDLCTGLHSIYITDANNCEGTVIWGGRWEEVVDSGVVVTINGVTTIPASCFNSNDGAANVQGANPLFSYTWETTSGVVIASGISYNNFYPGDYLLVAHYYDSLNSGLVYSGCDVSAPFTISSPSEIQTNATNPIAVTCYGDTDGEINLQIVGGTGFYTVQWDTTTSLPNGSNATLIDNLQPGTYTANIIDSDGCMITNDFVIGEPDVLTNDFIINQPLCSGLNGTLSANTQGGTGTYSYAPPIAGGFAAGTVTFTITDQNGCSTEDIAVFVDPDPIVSSLEPDNLYFGPYDVSCNGASDGSATVVAGGGTSIISYDWSPGGSTAATANNLSAGTYTVNVEDDNGCDEQQTITITEPDVLVAVVSKSGDSAPFDISCYDYSDGWAQSEPTGGVAATSGYNFNWQLSGSSFSTNYYVEDLAAGNNYTVTVTDANGCVVSESTGLLTEPVDFIAAVGTDYIDPLNSPATVIFTDNTISSDPYNFTWNWADGNTEFYSNGTSTFNLDFTDKFGMNDIYVSIENELTGCIDSVGFKIEVQGIPEINNVFTPNGDNVNDFFSFSEYAMKEITVEIFNRWGQIVYSWNTPAYAWDGRDYDGRNLAEGVYYYVLSSQGLDGELYSEKGSITLLR